MGPCFIPSGVGNPDRLRRDVAYLGQHHQICIDFKRKGGQGTAGSSIVRKNVPVNRHGNGLSDW
jgi:hypothetical protein